MKELKRLVSKLHQDGRNEKKMALSSESSELKGFFFEVSDSRSEFPSQHSRQLVVFLLVQGCDDKLKTIEANSENSNK